MDPDVKSTAGYCKTPMFWHLAGSFTYYITGSEIDAEAAANCIDSVVVPGIAVHDPGKRRSPSDGSWNIRNRSGTRPQVCDSSRRTYFATYLLFYTCLLWLIVCDVVACLTMLELLFVDVCQIAV